MPQNYSWSPDGTHKITITDKGVYSGVSFDYWDKLKELVDEGIFVDEKNDGFTKADRDALGEEFFTLHTERGESTKFKQMMAGTSFNYNDEEFIRLAKAAGYVLKEEEQKPSLDIKEQEVETEVPEEEKPAEVKAEVPEVEQEEGNEAISQSGKQTVQSLMSGLENGSYQVDAQFEGIKIVDGQTGEVVYESADGTINGQKFKYENGKLVLDGELKPEQEQQAQAVAEDNNDSDDLAALQKMVDLMDSIENDEELAGKGPIDRSEILAERIDKYSHFIWNLSNEKVLEGQGKRKILGLFGPRGDKKLKPGESAQYHQEEIAQLKTQLEQAEMQKAYIDKVERGRWEGQSTYTTKGQSVTVGNKVQTPAGRFLEHEGKYYTVNMEKVGNQYVVTRGIELTKEEAFQQ